MFLFSADSGARPVPLNSCSDVLLHLRKRGRHGHLELKCWINPTESFQIAQVLFCSVNFCSFRLAVLRLHGLRLCTQAVHSHLQAPRSGRGALRRGPERGLFRQIIIKIRSKNDEIQLKNCKICENLQKKYTSASRKRVTHKKHKGVLLPSWYREADWKESCMWYFVAPFHVRTFLNFGRWYTFHVVDKVYSLWFNITMSDAATCRDISDVLELLAKNGLR